MGTLKATRQAIKARILADTVLSLTRDMRITAGYTDDVVEIMYDAAKMADEGAHVAFIYAITTVHQSQADRLGAVIERQVYERRKVAFPKQYI